MSRGSGRSHNSHRKHRRHRSRHRRTESGSENEGSRCRSFSGHRKSTGSMELLDSNQHWRDSQRHTNDSSMVNSGLKNSENDLHGNQKSRRNRKNRFVSAFVLITLY